jgi:hypothetical protein
MWRLPLALEWEREQGERGEMREKYLSHPHTPAPPCGIICVYFTDKVGGSASFSHLAMARAPYNIG